MKNFNKNSILLILLAAVIILSSVTSAQEDEDRSIADLREDIDNMELASKEYGDINNMWSKTVLMLYEMERVNVSADVKQFIFSVEDFLTTFESAYKKSKTGGVSERKECIKKGSDMKKMALDMESYKNDPELKEYLHVPIIVDNAKSSVIRFLDDEGVYFEEKAEYENITPIKMWYLEDAISAYVESGNDEKKQEVQDKYKEINSEFLNDIKTAGEEKAKADALLNKSHALKDSQNILELFSAFWSSIDAERKYDNIEKIYKGYNLNAKGCSGNCSSEYCKKCSHKYYETFIEVGTKKNYAFEISDSLKGTILLYLAVIAVILLMVVFIFKQSYSNYSADTRDAKLGKELGLDKN